jgi:hypothetical protein
MYNSVVVLPIDGFGVTAETFSDLLKREDFDRH